MPGLRARLLIATFLLCSSLVAGTFWCAQHAARNAARERFGEVAEATLRQMREAAQNRIDALDHGVAMAVLDPVFRAQLSRLRQSDADFGLADSEAGAALPIAEVHDVLASAELPYFQRHDFFLIATNDKKLLLNRAQPAASGLPVPPALLDRADRQATAAEFLPGDSEALKALGADPTRLYLIIVRKIMAAGQPLGYVVVGESVREGLLKELDQVSQAHAGFRIGNRQWFRDAGAASVAGHFLEQRAMTAAGSTPSLPFSGKAGTDVEWQGQEYFVKTADSGLILVKPVSGELGLLTRELGKQFLVFIIPLSLLALLAAYFFARFFSKPILELTEEVRKVKAGNYAAKMPVLRTDEVGELARAFNEMTESLSALRIDPLTGLYTEQYLKDTLAFELTYALTRKRPLALVNLALADFESTIQRVGEDEARHLLQRFAEHLSVQHKRTKDVAARSDEDEFWLLLIDTDVHQARELCQQLLADRHEAMPPLHLGLALFNAHIGDADDFMQAARTAREDAGKLGDGGMALARGTLLGG